MSDPNRAEQYAPPEPLCDVPECVGAAVCEHFLDDLLLAQFCSDHAVRAMDMPEVTGA